MCFTSRDASTGIQHDLLDHYVTSPDLDLRSDFDQGLLMSTYICINSSRREEHDGVRFSHGFVCSEVIYEKNVLAKNNIWILLYGPLPLSLMSRNLSNSDGR